jgi:hypothetical protein
MRSNHDQNHVPGRREPAPARAFVSALGIAVLLALSCPGPAQAEPAVLRDCAPLTGAETLLAPGKTVLVGEVHGTEQVPQWAGDLVCLALKKKLSVTVSLEMDSDETPRLAAYLRSPGTPADRARVLAGRFWSAPFQDGRSSRAVFALLERLRRFAAAGLPVRVLADDVPTGLPHNRDEYMAHVLHEERFLHPNDLILAVGGMNHMWTLAEPPHRGAGYHLESWGVPVTPLRVLASGGKHWQCGGGECIWDIEIPSEPRGPHAFVEMLPERRNGFDGVLYLGKVTPSEPAAEPPKGGWQRL